MPKLAILVSDEAKPLSRRNLVMKEAAERAGWIVEIIEFNRVKNRTGISFGWLDEIGKVPLQ